MRSRGALAILASSLLAFAVLPACSTTANVVDVYMGLDAPDDTGQTRRRNVFFTDSKAIHCIAVVGQGRPDATFEVFIRQILSYDLLTKDTKDVDRYLSYREMTLGRGTEPTYLDVEFTAEDDEGNEAPYPPGSYVCEVALDGVLMGTAGFNIVVPPCPPATIPQGGICLGYYPVGTECPKYGELSGDPQTCICDPEGWRCRE